MSQIGYLKASKPISFFLLIGMLFYMAISLLSSSIPFFWDMVEFSRISQFYYSGNFKQLIVPEIIDSGHPPLFGIYLAVCWKIFGKSLFIYHLSILPFMLGVFWHYYKLAKKWISPRSIPLALLLLWIEPTYLTQCILGSMDILIVYFFLLAINSLLEKKLMLFALSLVFLSLLSLRGFLMILPIGLYHLLSNFEYKINKTVFKINRINSSLIWPYIPAFVSIILWGTYHWHQTGWAFSPPSRWEHRSLASPERIFRNSIYIIWKMVDFGRIFLWVIFLFACTKKELFRKISFSWLWLFLCCLFFFFISMAPLTNPIGHRYFMIIYLLLSIGISEIIMSFSWNKSIWLSTCSALFLFSGNFILYPEKYGNGWDSSLKCLAFFKLKEQMHVYIENNDIDTHKTGSAFPLRANPSYTHLLDKSYGIGDKDSIPFQNYSYILQSNVCNLFSEKQIQLLHSKKYQELARYQSGQVYVSLYKKLE